MSESVSAEGTEMSKMSINTPHIHLCHAHTHTTQEIGGYASAAAEADAVTAAAQSKQAAKEGHPSKSAPLGRSPLSAQVCTVC